MASVGFVPLRLVQFEPMKTDKSYTERLLFLRQRDNLENAADAARAYGLNVNTFKSIANGTRNLTKAQADLISRHHRVSTGWLMFGEGEPDGRNLTAISGYVGAGQEFHYFEQDTGNLVSLIIGNDEVLAFEVRGESMLPAYRSGDIVFVSSFTKRFDDVVGDECLVRLEDGRHLLKIVEPGSRKGLITLLSWNTEPIRDIQMHSAAPVVAVKRNRNRVHSLSKLAKSLTA